tara:strand:- start:255 stop:656 length:402 start_codon:yes stop_codon:yes gene_type:complete
MSFIISLIINLKNSKISEYDKIIKDAGNNCMATYIYNDNEIEGINNYIKTNDKVIVLEFDLKINLVRFLNFITTIKEIKIEFISHKNKIIYCSNKYLNKLDNCLYDKELIINNINDYKKNKEFNDIYSLIVHL